mgnify:CR=1 FL=1
MYIFVLAVHSWVRWVALVAGFGATLAAMRDPSPTPNARAERWGLFLMMALDIQLLLGLLLYLGLSPYTAAARTNFGDAARDPQLRFWAVDHAAAMFLAVILVHAARVLARTAKTPESRRARLLVCFGLATFAMLFGMPWPGLPNGRPLFRF